jgi:ribosomal protein S17E
MTAKEIIEKHNLTFQRLFEEKEEIALATYPDGTPAVVKGYEDEAYQFRILSEMEERELPFRVPRVYEMSQEEEYVVMEYLDGEEFGTMFEYSPEEVIERAWKAIPAYNAFVREVIDREAEDIAAEGRSWTENSLREWSQPLVERDILTNEDVEYLLTRVKELEETHGAELFALTHKNMIYKHFIRTKEGETGIVDVGASPRPGLEGMYSYVRFLDFMMLVTTEPERILEEYVKPKYQELVERYPKDMVDFVFALRFIGTLGWDIYHHQMSIANGGQGASAEQKQVLEDWLKRFLPKK